MDKGKITAAFATLLLTTTIIASFILRVAATPTATFSCQIQTTNLADEAVAGLTVKVYNATTNIFLDSEVTNSTGWASFLLDSGNHTFKAFQGNVEVGVLPNQIIQENKTLTLKCWLAHIEIVVKNEADEPLPFIDVTISSTYAINEFETNGTGTVKQYNTFFNTTYTIEAQRYGFLFFNTTFIDKLPSQPWLNLTIICPTYATSLHVVDSIEEPLPSVQVSIAEWSSMVIVYGGATDDQGNVNFSATFGRYKVKVYNYSAVLEREIVLNETLFNLIENRSSVEVHCSIFNVELHVATLDYFGQPIPNALVEVERKFELEWVGIESRTTGVDGFARFVPLRGLVGGDCQVSVYVAGKLCEVKYLYLEGSKQILFKIDKYTVIAGHPVETGQLIACVSTGLLVVVFGLSLTYRRLLRRSEKKKTEP